jgi:hypothetical protein
MLRLSASQTSTAPLAHQQVALPMAGDGSIFDLGRALGDHHHPGELALALAL